VNARGGGNVLWLVSSRASDKLGGYTPPQTRIQRKHSSLSPWYVDSLSGNLSASVRLSPRRSTGHTALDACADAVAGSPDIPDHHVPKIKNFRRLRWDPFC